MSPAARPSLLPVAAFVSLLVLVLAATGLFALHHTNEKTAADLSRLNAVEETSLLALRTRAAFKTQVQEWKNILLRGRSPDDLLAFKTRFEEEETVVREGLATLSEKLPAIADGGLLSDISALAVEHGRLGGAYRAALAAYDPADPQAPFRADAAVRGIDRRLNEQLDALAASAGRLAADELRALADRSAARYEALRRITWIVASLAVLASLWLCFRAARLSA